MSEDQSDNTQITGKRKAPKTAWKKGQSGNPRGAPRRGDSWAETIKKLAKLDGPAIAQMWDTQAGEFAKLPEGISVKTLAVMSVFASMLRDPSPGLWKELMDRAEGKVKDVIEHDGNAEKPIEVVVRYAVDNRSAEPTQSATGDQATGETL